MRAFVARVVVADLVVMAASMVLAWPLRDMVFPGSSTQSAHLWYLVAPLLSALWLTVQALVGAYEHRVFGAGAEEFARITKAAVLTGVGATSFCYLANLELSRGFVLFTFLIGGTLLLLERRLLRGWLHRRRQHGHYVHRVLAVGSPAALKVLAHALGRQRSLGYEIVAVTPTSWNSRVALPAPHKGTLGTVRSTALEVGADTIMVTAGTDLPLRELTWELEGCDIELVVVPSLAGVAAPRLQMRPVGGLPLVHVEEPQAALAARWPKRAFDLVGAGGALLLLSPVMLLVAALIKLEDRGPIFYRQLRVGLNGDTFHCWKFRSMAVNADEIDAELRSQYAHEVLFKLENDPRLTRVGKFLRRYSVDEVPQLFNVLNGTMSLVGPRPHRPLEVDAYSGEARRRLHVLPGMTGLWQVSGRANLGWEEAVRLDLYYRDNWSMFTDFVIIAKTIKAVVGKEGAY